MHTERGKAFDRDEPTLDTAETLTAFETGRAAISLAVLPCLAETRTIEYLAVKFALANGNFATVLLDRLAAAALREAIKATGQVQWDGNTLRAGPSAH